LSFKGFVSSWVLLENGADVNTKATVNNIEWTALKLAKARSHMGAVRLLEMAAASEGQRHKK
jgi:hypothetical protein